MIEPTSLDQRVPSELTTIGAGGLDGPGPLIKSRPLIFLDIDGVLNGHGVNLHSECCGISPSCVGHLNRILKETGARYVVSSAWRYLVLGGSMTCRGMEYLLRTHGVMKDRMVGVTCSDELVPSRGAQVWQWLEARGFGYNFCIVDDGDPVEYGFSGMPHVTVPSVGLGWDVSETIIQKIRSVSDGKAEEKAGSFA